MVPSLGALAAEMPEDILRARASQIGVPCPRIN
jgi:hypothetical protein